MELQIQNKLDEETKIQEAARDGIMVEHDCHLSENDGCEICERWYEARDFWVREQSELIRKLRTMKSKIHLAINQYEFVEFEKEGEFTPEEIASYHEKYHNLIQDRKVKRTAKVQNRTYDFVQDLPEPDEAINIDG